MSILRLLEELPYRMSCELEALLREGGGGASVRGTENYVDHEEPERVSDWPEGQSDPSFLDDIGDWVFAITDEVQ